MENSTYRMNSVFGESCDIPRRFKIPSKERRNFGKMTNVYVREVTLNPASAGISSHPHESPDEEEKTVRCAETLAA